MEEMQPKGEILMDIHETLARQLPLYARVLLEKGINLQKDQILVINTPVESHSFASLLAEEAYKAGAAQVVFNWYCNETTRLRYQYETQDKFETVPQWRSEFNLYYYRKGAAFLSLISADPYTMEGIDRKKIFAWQKAFHQAVKEYSDGMMASRTNWLVAAVPGTVWAKLLYPELPEQEGMDKLWLQILDVSRCLGDDPLADWDKHLAELKQRREWLTAQQFTALEYTSPKGTKLTVGLPEHHIWQGGAESTTRGFLFNANIPTEEVYSAPQADRVDGVVWSTKPLVYNGNLIENFRFTFQDGKVVDVQAEKGEDILKDLIQMDEGACRLGEVALVPYHSPISLTNRIFYETLFDENAACHLALGDSYPTCLENGPELTEEQLKKAGLNDSMIHVDFMVGSPDLTITGIKKDGTKVPVFVDGDWA
jgi:aminopeptidase